MCTIAYPLPKLCTHTHTHMLSCEDKCALSSLAPTYILSHPSQLLTSHTKAQCLNRVQPQSDTTKCWHWIILVQGQLTIHHEDSIVIPLASLSSTLLQPLVNIPNIFILYNLTLFPPSFMGSGITEGCAFSTHLYHCHCCVFCWAALSNCV